MAGYIGRQALQLNTTISLPSTLTGVTIAQSTIDNSTIENSTVDSSNTVAGSGGGGGVDVGTIVSFGATYQSLPSGFLECNGATISRTTYADLFNVISTTFGSGDGSTTFKIPDLRGAFIRGYGASGSDTKPRGNLYPYESSTIFGGSQNTMMQGHEHTTYTTIVPTTSSGTFYNKGAPGISPQYSLSWGGGPPAYYSSLYGTPTYGDETRPFNIALLFMIKY